MTIEEINQIQRPWVLETRLRFFLKKRGLNLDPESCENLFPEPERAIVRNCLDRIEALRAQIGSVAPVLNQVK